MSGISVEKTVIQSFIELQHYNTQVCDENPKSRTKKLET